MSRTHGIKIITKLLRNYLIIFLQMLLEKKWNQVIIEKKNCYVWSKHMVNTFYFHSFLDDLFESVRYRINKFFAIIWIDGCPAILVCIEPLSFCIDFGYSLNTMFLKIYHIQGILKRTD